MPTETTASLSFFDLTPAELEAQLAEWGEPRYRAAQVFSWIYRKGAQSFSEMTNLPEGLRVRLDEHFSLDLPEVAERVGDREAEKFSFRLSDGCIIESVCIHSTEGRTLCLSMQVGCDLSCRFCASGQMAFRRNLSAGEMVGQVLALERQFGRPSNLVYMGMGEPFLNYDATMKSLSILQEPKGYAFGARRITVSTAGIVPEIYRFAREAGQVNLAISLHATTDAKRQALMPVARVYNLRQLLDAAWDYTEVTGRRISFEYVLIRGVNDSHHDADRLIEMLGGKRAHLNIICFNPIPRGLFKRPARKELERFVEYLRKGGLNVTVRRSVGAQSAAACGQLAGKEERGPTPK